MTLTPQLAQQCLELIDFLHGSAPLDGVWFGDKHPTERGAFWWRKRLSALREALASGEGDEARDGPLDAEDLKKIALVHEEFDDCGETSVDYEELMRFARMGLLECTHFMVTVKAREAIAKASPLGPLGDAAMKGSGNG